MNASLLKRADAVIGPVAARLLGKRRAPEQSAAPRSILVIRPGGIGDAVLLAPALGALQAAYPGCAIDILAERRNAQAFLLVPGIRSVHRYDALSGIASLFLKSYDLVIDTEQWYRLSSVVARLVRASRSIGFSGNERGRLFSYAVDYPHELYEAASFFRLLEPLGLKAPEAIATPFLTLPDASVEAAERLIAPLQGREFVTLFPGASVPEKQWGVANFKEVAGMLGAAGIMVVVVGGEDCRSAAAKIAAGGLALDLSGQASLVESAALLAKGRVLLSGDSGLLHIAAGLGTPTVSLFGPSDPRKWGPRGDGHVVFDSGLTCAPCSLFGTIPPCAGRGGCLDAVAPRRVADAVARLWERRPEILVPVPEGQNPLPRG